MIFSPHKPFCVDCRIVGLRALILHHHLVLLWPLLSCLALKSLKSLKSGYHSTAHQKRRRFISTWCIFYFSTARNDAFYWNAPFYFIRFVFNFLAVFKTTPF